MRVRKVRLVLWLCVGFANAVLAQKENNVWVGGINTVINFNSGSPVVSNRPDNNNLWRTNASICDADGNLLFYTNGYRVFNKNFQVMENGDDLNIGDYQSWGYNLLSATDAAAIVPVPEQAGRY